MITLENIHKSFDGTEILHGITATMEAGKINTVIGASGSGKSVLMKCLVGLLSVNEGKIYYDGREFTEMPYKEVRELRRELGMLFQGTALFDSLTVEQNVEFTLKMFTKMTPAERRDRVDFCLSKVNLTGINNQFPSEISGGMKKRVGIARAIALDIKYLFADEPNSGLDPITSRVIDELIKDITQEFNITTIINTHDMKTVFDIGDTVLFIHEGSASWQGLRSEVRGADNKYLHAFIAASHFEE